MKGVSWCRSTSVSIVFLLPTLAILYNSSRILASHSVCLEALQIVFRTTVLLFYLPITGSTWIYKRQAPLSRSEPNTLIHFSLTQFLIPGRYVSLTLECSTCFVWKWDLTAFQLSHVTKSSSNLEFTREQLHSFEFTLSLRNEERHCDQQFRRHDFIHVYSLRYCWCGTLVRLGRNYPKASKLAVQLLSSYDFFL